MAWRPCDSPASTCRASVSGPTASRPRRGIGASSARPWSRACAHIDIAHLYTGGESERAIGEALEGAAADVLVATKGGYGGAGQGRPEALRRQIEQSLRSLRSEAIGLYYLHRVDPEADRGHDDVVDFCERERIAFVPYYPLRGGGLRVAAAAERLGVTENAVKLARLLRRSPVVLPIPGTLSIEHLRENLAALEIDPRDADEIAD